ncbi:MAG: hypothetical protein KGN78_07475 [Actinomycetales bacterium]|nr:hypothetical protein [Actinomycetales bacterium]
MMFLMLVLWIPVLVGVALKARWTMPLGFANLVLTIYVLNLHITSTIPLNF